MAQELDDALLDAMESRLYPRLRETLLTDLRQEREQVPPYYEQYISSEVRRLEQTIANEVRRLEEAIEHKRERIDELGPHSEALRSRPQSPSYQRQIPGWFRVW